MCRAVWVLIYAANAGASKRLRVAVGAEAQVVGDATTSDVLIALIATTRADALIVDAGAPNAAVIASMSARDRAVIWVGHGAPDGLLAISNDDTLAAELPSAITRALIARR